MSTITNILLQLSLMIEVQWTPESVLEQNGRHEVLYCIC